MIEFPEGYEEKFFKEEGVTSSLNFNGELYYHWLAIEDVIEAIEKDSKRMYTDYKTLYAKLQKTSEKVDGLSRLSLLILKGITG